MVRKAVDVGRWPTEKRAGLLGIGAGAVLRKNGWPSMNFVQKLFGEGKGFSQSEHKLPFIRQTASVNKFRSLCRPHKELADNVR